LLKADGSKFGKSESGALWLDQNLTTPYEIYQYFLNASDADVVNYLKSLTLLSKTEIEALEHKMILEPEQREAQKTLAAEIVKLVHGEKALQEAVKVTNALFSGEFSDLSHKELMMLSKTLDTLQLDAPKGILDVLVETNLSSSKREARTFIQSGAILLNDRKIGEVEYMVTKELSMYDTFIIVRRGKKKYAMIIFK